MLEEGDIVTHLHGCTGSRGICTVIKCIGLRARVRFPDGSTMWAEVKELSMPTPTAQAAAHAAAEPSTATTNTIAVKASSIRVETPVVLAAPSVAKTSKAAEPIPVNTNEAEQGATLVLPSEDADEWAYVLEVLRGPMSRLSDLDTMLTKFCALDRESRRCSFFSEIPGSDEAGVFDFDAFFTFGVPLLLEVALEMPTLFAGVRVPIHKTYSSWSAVGDDARSLGLLSFSLSRRQCACLLAHSFLGSLKRPHNVQPNDFRFTAVDLFVGTARSPNSATTFLNYFTTLGTHGFPVGQLTFERLGYRSSAHGHPPWRVEHSLSPLCAVTIVDGPLEDSLAELHADFANAFPGGGVMTGDFAQEEILFLIKPELLVAMALENRMADTEAVRVFGAVQYSLVSGFGSSFAFAGAYDGRRAGAPPTVCAIDAVRGGGPAMTEPALRRDLNKARIAFDGARTIATGHWGCGAFGNNHDLMFVKQWLAASEAGATAMHYHDFSRNQSHNIVPLTRKLKHLTVGQLWGFLRDNTFDLEPANVAAFSVRVREIATGKRAVPAAAAAVDVSDG